jgi:K(+)-stimulated pyrophosphate-energized sodium pump
MLSLLIAILASAGALVFALVVARSIIAEDEGDDTMKTIATAIQEGASAFLQREYTFLAGFVVVVAIVLTVFIDYDVLDRFGEQAGNLTDAPRTAFSYVIGAIASALAGFVGMMIAVRANVRTAAKARTGLNPALRVAFSSGVVMGMSVVGISLM